MTNGGVDRSIECTGNINAMISAFECVHDVLPHLAHIELELFTAHSFSFFYVDILEFRDSQGWGVAVLVGVPHKDAVFQTHPVNLLNERTLKGTFFGNYKPRSDLPSVVEKYMNKVIMISPLQGTWLVRF